MIAREAKKEFIEKINILDQEFQQISSMDFYERLFGDIDREFLYVIENKTYKTAMNFNELIDVACFRSDVYTPPASFFKNCFSLKTLKQLFAIVIDIDNIKPHSLQLICQKMKVASFKYKPTLIMNSGGGLHLYYIFNEPIECYHTRHATLKALISKLQEIWSSRVYKVDKNISLIQSFRVAGSLNKYKQKTTAYKVGEKYELKKLAKYLNVNLWDETKKKRPNTKTVGYEKDVIILPNGDKPFYDHCFFRIAEEVEVGHRYTALYSLAIVGYKCRIGKEKVEEDIKLLVDIFNERVSPNKRIREIEIEKALKGYSQDRVKVTSVTLENWLGFKFPRKTKRNGRTQKEHLEMARKAKTSKEKLISELLNRGFNKNQIANTLKMTNRNLDKTYSHLFNTNQNKRGEKDGLRVKEMLAQGLSKTKIAKAVGLSRTQFYRVYSYLF